MAIFHCKVFLIVRVLGGRHGSEVAVWGKEVRLSADTLGGSGSTQKVYRSLPHFDSRSQWEVEMFCGLEGRGGLWLKHGHISLHDHEGFTSPGLDCLLHKTGAAAEVQTTGI